jgi:hypothetical protein
MHANGELSEADVVRIARDECTRCGLPWREPYSVRKGWRYWRVLTPSNIRGGNTLVVISRTTREVRIRHYPR